MTYKPEYTRNPLGKFDPDKAFSAVRAGTGAYLTEDETNEMQAILREQNRDGLRRVVTSGVLGELKVTVDESRENTFRIAPFEAIVDGILVKVIGANATETPRTEEDGEDNLVTMAGQFMTWDREELVLLEVYEEEVKGDDVILKHGVQQGQSTLPNDLLDERIGGESTRRTQVKCLLRVVEDAEADWQMDSKGNPCVEIAPNLYRSDEGRLLLILLRKRRIYWDQELTTVFYDSPPIASVRAELLMQSNSDLYPYHTLGVPFGNYYESGFVPLLRFFNWYTSSSPGGSYLKFDTAKNWIENLQYRSGSAWDFFTGLEHMNAYNMKWVDKNLQLSTYNGGPHYAENVSILCLQNGVQTPQNCDLLLKYASNAAQQSYASASYAYAIIDPAGRPYLSGIFTLAWAATATETATKSVSIEVPPGHVIIVVLKTSPMFVSSSASAYWYHNFHGIESNSSATRANFKPHLATYRRLLKGSWL